MEDNAAQGPSTPGVEEGVPPCSGVEQNLEQTEGDDKTAAPMPGIDALNPPREDEPGFGSIEEAEVLVQVCRFLGPKDLGRLACVSSSFGRKTCWERMVGVGSVELRSVVEETARRWVTARPIQEQAWAPEGTSWLQRMHELQMQGAAATLSGLKDKAELSQCGSVLTMLPSNSDFEDTWKVSASKVAMHRGQHYAAFTPLAGCNRIGPCYRCGFGLTRPDSDQGCFIHVAAGYDDYIGLFLDFDAGSLTCFKNGDRLGTMVTGLAGELCWAVKLFEYDSIRISGSQDAALAHQAERTAAFAEIFAWAANGSVAVNRFGYSSLLCCSRQYSGDSTGVVSENTWQRLVARCNETADAALAQQTALFQQADFPAPGSGLAGCVGGYGFGLLHGGTALQHSEHADIDVTDWPSINGTVDPAEGFLATDIRQLVASVSCFFDDELGLARGGTPGPVFSVPNLSMGTPTNVLMEMLDVVRAFKTARANADAIAQAQGYSSAHARRQAENKEMVAWATDGGDTLTHAGFMRLWSVLGEEPHGAVDWQYLAESCGFDIVVDGNSRGHQLYNELTGFYLKDGMANARNGILEKARQLKAQAQGYPTAHAKAQAEIQEIFIWAADGGDAFTYDGFTRLQLLIGVDRPENERLEKWQQLATAFGVDASEGLKRGDFHKLLNDHIPYTKVIEMLEKVREVHSSRES